MKILITQNNITLGDTQVDFINEKLLKLQKYSEAVKDESSEIKVNVDKDETKNPDEMIEVRVTMILPIEELSASERAHAPEVALMAVKEKLLRQLEKYKERHNRHTPND